MKINRTNCALLQARLQGLYVDFFLRNQLPVFAAINEMKMTSETSMNKMISFTKS